MTIQQLQEALTDAIATERYEDAHVIKLKIAELQSAEPVTETLYQDAVGYVRSAPEQFSGTHDTTAKKWEHTGVVVDGSNQEISDTINEAFPHEVEKIQLNNPKQGKASQFYSLNYGDQELPVSVKKNYVPHTRKDIITLCCAAEEAFNGKVKIATCFKNGHYVSIQPTDEYRRIVFGGKNNDSINPRLIITAPCGGGAYKGSLGWFRDVCNNLTWLKSIAVFSQSIQHSSKLAELHKSLVNSFEIVANGWETTVDYMNQMEQRAINTENFLVRLLGDRPADDGAKQTRYDNRIKQLLGGQLSDGSVIPGIIASERMKLGKAIGNPCETVTAWEMFNAIQGYSQHVQTRKNNPSAFDRIVSAANEPLVNQAESMLFAETLDPMLAA